MAITSAPTEPKREKAQEKDNSEELSATTAAQEKAQLAMRNAMRRDCESVLRSGAADHRSAMVDKDVRDYMAAYDESDLNWADTHEKKMEALEVAKQFAHDFVHKASDFGQEFLEEVKRAKKKEWKGKSMERWQKKLKERNGNEKWPDARERLMAYLRANLKDMSREWDALDDDIEHIHRLCQKSGFTPRDVPELSLLTAEGFEDQKFPARRSAVNRVLKAIHKRAAEQQERDALHEEALSLFHDAVTSEFLAPSKAARAMQTIFAPSNKLPGIRRYVQKTLPSYQKNWQAEAMEYDLQEARAEGLPIRLLPKASFLALSFEARGAYLRLTDARLNRAERDAKESDVLEAFIHKSIDMEDWSEARALLKTAKGKFPDEPAWKDIETILASAPADAEEPGERDPKEVAQAMRQRVAGLPDSVQKLYKGALELDDNQQETGANHFRTVTVMMNNADILHERGAIKESSDIQEPDQPQEEMEAKVVYMENTPESHLSVLEQIKTNKSNDVFVSETALALDVPEETRQELTTVNRQLLRDARYLEEKGHSLNMSEKPQALAA